MADLNLREVIRGIIREELKTELESFIRPMLRSCVAEEMIYLVRHDNQNNAEIFGDTYRQLDDRIAAGLDSDDMYRDMLERVLIGTTRLIAGESIQDVLEHGINKSEKPCDTKLPTTP